MLSVNDSKGRSRSKSPGRRDRDKSPARAKSPVRAVSPPKSKSSRSSRTKKRYEEESETETESETDSEEERRSSRRKKDDKERRRRKDESDESDSEDEKRYSKEAKYERKRHDDRHPSHSEPSDRYEYATIPGGYIATEPGEYVIAGGGRGYQVAPKYEYAQPTQNIKYLSKSEVVGKDGKKYYVQTSQPQMEYVTRKPSRRDSEDKHGKSRRDSDDDKHKKSRKGTDDDKHKKSRKDSDDERSKPSRRDSERDKHDKHRKSSRYDTESESETDSEDDRRKKSSKSKSSRRDSDSDRDRRKKDKHRESDAHDKRPKFVEVEPRGLKGGMQRLSVGSGAMTLAAPGGHGIIPLSGGLPPGSPLLEAYRGTYQSISPMPSPMAMPAHMNDGLSDLEPLEGDSDDGRGHKSRKTSLKKRVEIYDPEPDAKAIAAELKSTKPGSDPLIEILPPLSDDNMMHLRAEYKKHFKVNGKGINVAKHIKLKVPGNIGKIAYATSLGRWESEAYWANFWYQSGSSRRELLIESLIGRSNAEIRKIKEAFSDKRYNDSLEKCMQTELKKDKFRNAILLALQEKRQDELTPASKNLVSQDVRDLYKALTSKEGGESAMIEIIIVRSDLHLRQVLKEFEERYKRNFAREMIQKSQNLVGETLAHVLNGVLNKPVRDAQLLHQALAETSKDRTELLVSRLVRYHWEPKHLDRIKLAYKQKYGTKLERDIESGTKGDFGEFCLALTEGATR